MILLGQDVHHATLGIIGLGRIGPAVGKRARGFNMKVICYDTVRRPDLENELGVEFADLNTPLAKSDFVTIHTSFLAETHHLIGEEQFRLVKKAATSSDTQTRMCCSWNAREGPRSTTLTGRSTRTSCWSTARRS